MFGKKIKGIISIISIMFLSFISITPVFAIDAVKVSVDLETNAPIEIRVAADETSPAPEQTSIKFDKNAKINFSFDKLGEYHYTVKVVSKDTSEYKYDRDSEYNITVSVFRSEKDVIENVVVISKKGSTEKLDKLQFKATPVPKPSPSPSNTPAPVPVPFINIPVAQYINTAADKHMLGYLLGLIGAFLGLTAAYIVKNKD